MAAFSSNGLLRGLARAYVEVVRNIPLLLQLVFWYFVVFLALPNGTAAWQLPGVVLAKSGLYVAGLAGAAGGNHGTRNWQCLRDGLAQSCACLMLDFACCCPR